MVFECKSGDGGCRSDGPSNRTDIVLQIWFLAEMSATRRESDWQMEKHPAVSSYHSLVFTSAG